MNNIQASTSQVKAGKKLNNGKLPCVVALDDSNAQAKPRLKDKAVKLKHLYIPSLIQNKL